MAQEKIEKTKREHNCSNDDNYATHKDLEIMSLKLENKINSMTTRLGALTVSCFGILMGFLTYWHK